VTLIHYWIVINGLCLSKSAERDKLYIAICSEVNIQY